ncbi:polysaccharide biosynthesis C-terminal domain-containing protein [Sphingobacterium sp. SG20118]|uniref:polysaccharide biosynthesis C-terminal domain-containing protein n=1 Tax=Sphingobacterium sp. SG20118 TaxID=3367156 RepID=UPI0037DFBE8C
MIGTSYRSGLGIVPILLCANICLGIYYNLTVWYKLTNRMQMGLYITLFGAVITLLGNYLFIPDWGIYAAAWTTLTCYAAMMIVTYFVGQKYYYIPYPVKSILLYLSVMLICFFLKLGIDSLSLSLSKNLQLTLRLPTATILLILYTLFILKMERKELKEMPLIGRFIS